LNIAIFASPAVYGFAFGHRLQFSTFSKLSFSLSLISQKVSRARTQQIELNRATLFLAWML